MKGGWFQIHLSTAIALLMAVAALMFLNMRSVWPGERENGIVSWLPDELRNDPRSWEYGWPLKAYHYVPFATATSNGFHLAFSWNAALVDALVFVGVLLAVFTAGRFINRQTG